mgnify:CR=1 FL=1
MKIKIKQLILPLFLMITCVVLYAFTNVKPHRLLTLERSVHQGVFDANIETNADTNLIFVNIGTLPRQDLAQLIDKIGNASPQAMAVFICFDKTKTSPYDSLLTNVLQKHREKIILNNNPAEGCIKYEGVNTKITAIKTNESYFRYWNPAQNSLEKNLVQKIDPEKVKALEALPSQTLINYQLSFQNVRMLEGQKILDFDLPPRFFEHNIIYLGYITDSLPPDINKTPFTPAKFVYPLLASANVTHNILKEAHLKEVGVWLSIVVTLALVIFHLLVAWLMIRLPAITYFSLALLFSYLATLISIAIMFYWHLSNGLVMYMSYTWAWVLGGYLLVWGWERLGNKR